MNEVEYEWALEDADGNWQAGGSSSNVEDAKKEAAHYLLQYANDDVAMHYKVFKVTRELISEAWARPE